MIKVDFPQKKQIVVVGAGGTGSWFLPILSKLGVEDVVVIDGDIVEPKNLTRQLFSKEDVGKNKAKTLAEKYEFGYSEEFLDGTEDIEEVFSDDVVPLIISLVDNNGTRKIFDDMFHDKKYKNFIYVDSGNAHRTGQIYAALKKDGKIIYETGVHLDKGLQDVTGANRRPSQLSCADFAQEPENSQNILANVTTACVAANVVTNILENGILFGNKYSFDCNFIKFTTETVGAE